MCESCILSAQSRQPTPTTRTHGHILPEGEIRVYPAFAGGYGGQASTFTRMGEPRQQGGVFSRHLERVVDHCTHTVEDSLYLIEGRIVRHQPERAEASA